MTAGGAARWWPSRFGADDELGGGIGENNVNWVTEAVSATMQLGTHIDALSHLQIGGATTAGPWASLRTPRA